MKIELMNILVWCTCPNCNAKFTHESPWSALRRTGYPTCDGYISWYYLEITCPDCKESEEVKIIDD